MESVYEKLLDSIPLPKHKKNHIASKRLGMYNGALSKKLGNYNIQPKKRLGVYC